jgi:hypothetical protein
MTLTRRTLLGSLFCAAAAPAIVRISSLMPVRAFVPDPVMVHHQWQEWLTLKFENGIWRVIDSRGETEGFWPFSPAPITPTTV